jgi:hypothetical protein
MHHCALEVDFFLIQTKWNAEQYNLKLKDYHLIVKSFSSLLVMARKLAVMHFKQSQNVTHFLIFELVYKRYKMIMEVMYSTKTLEAKTFQKWKLLK